MRQSASILIIGQDRYFLQEYLHLIEREVPGIRTVPVMTFPNALTVLNKASLRRTPFDVAIVDAELSWGEERTREEVRQFISLLLALEAHPRTAVLLISRHLGSDMYDCMTSDDVKVFQSFPIVDRWLEVQEPLVTFLRSTLGHQPLIVLPRRAEVIEVRGQFEQLLQESTRLEALLQLSPRDFEVFVAELWRRFGYDVELTMRTRDNGRDIVAVRKAETDIRIIVECKRYVPPKKVSVEIVRALYGVKAHEGASKAILATTSSFTWPAQDLLRSHPWELEGRDYGGIMDWIRRARQLR
jgi:hypothetical protein